MKRDDGKYWVKFPNDFKWRIAEWHEDHWVYYATRYTDSDFIAIHKTRIKTPDEN